MGLPEGGLVFGRGEPDGNGTRISVSYSLQDAEVRIVAIDTAGRLHTADRVTTSASGSVIQPEASFQDLPLELIGEFCAQSRPVQWVEFHNVSLEPGQRTEVQVIVGPKGASEQAHVAAAPASQEKPGAIRRRLCRRWRRG